MQRTLPPPSHSIVGMGAAIMAPWRSRRARFDGARFDAIVEDGIRRGAYPGAVLVIGRRDSVLYARGYGHLTWSGSSAVPDPDGTIWDLASLTKVVATTTALMLLVERGRVALDTPAVRYLPEFRAAGTAGKRLMFVPNFERSYSACVVYSRG